MFHLIGDRIVNLLAIAYIDIDDSKIFLMAPYGDDGSISPDYLQVSRDELTGLVNKMREKGLLS
jgi:hypothetical protein